MGAMPHSRLHHLDATAIAILLACCLFWGFQQVLVMAPRWPRWRRCSRPCALCHGHGGGAGVVPVAQGAPGQRTSHGGCWRRCIGRALFAAEFACIYIGLQYTTASRLTVFLYCSPFWVALLLPRFVPGVRGLRGWQWLGLAGAFAGDGAGPGRGLAGARQGRAAPGLAGRPAGPAGRAAVGLTTLTIRATPLGRVAPAKQLLFQVGISTAVLPLLSLALGERWSLDFSAFVASSLLVQALVGAFASYLAWMWLLTRYPATKISVFVFLTPYSPCCLRLVAGRAHHAWPAGRAGAGGSRHCAGEPQARPRYSNQIGLQRLLDKRNQLSKIAKPLPFERAAAWCSRANRISPSGDGVTLAPATLGKPDSAMASSFSSYDSS